MGDTAASYREDCFTAINNYIKNYGWKLFPVFMGTPRGCQCGRPDCTRPGKHPRTPNGLKDATDDLKKLKRWFERDGNIGMVTGEAAGGIIVVDIDPRHDGDISLSQLEEDNGILPATFTVLTGGGGTHLFYSTDHKIPSSVARIDKAGNLTAGIAKGIDIRAEGGYVILPPSRHISGQQYHQDLGCPDSVAPAPQWLLDLCRDGATRKGVTASVPDAVIEGGRNDFLASIGGALRRKGITEKAICATLLMVNGEKCKPPLDDEEVEKIAKSVARYLPASQNATWTALLKRDKNGNAKATAGNAAVYLTFREETQGLLAYNDLTDEIVLAKVPPDGFMRPNVDDIVGADEVLYFQHWLAKNCGPIFNLDDTMRAIKAVARRNTFHPIRGYLNKLQWDGITRLTTWLEVYLGASNDGPTSDIGVMWMISCIARVMRPGCQVDHMLVLEGDQGIGKTRACRILGGEWFGPKLPNLNSDYAGMYIQGKWIVEVGELGAIRGVTRERAKDFITQTVDSYKRPYDREITERPRQCVFVATTNSQQYLDDVENRRYWPITCKTVDHVALARDRDQLFAEAADRYKRGEKWFPDSKQSLALKELQDNRVIGDAWDNRLASFLFPRRDRFVSGDELLLQVGLEPQHMNRSHSMRIADVCRRLGWHATRAMVNGQRKRGYIYHGNPDD